MGSSRQARFCFTRAIAQATSSNPFLPTQHYFTIPISCIRRRVPNRNSKVLALRIRCCIIATERGRLERSIGIRSRDE